MERKNLIRSALTVIGRSGLFNRAACRRGIRLAPLLLAAVMLAAVAVLAETSNPAQTAHAHDDDTHTHRCTSPPDERCPGYGDVAGEPPEIWSATLTVGQRPGDIDVWLRRRARLRNSRQHDVYVQRYAVHHQPT